MQLLERTILAPTNQNLIISANGVVKTYDTGSATVQALKKIDFAVERGEMVAVMGPSGCGKTTLLNTLSGLDTIDEGTIWLEGKDLATMSDKERTRYRAQRMGFIFQVYNLLPVLSAVENVELTLLLSGVRPREARERAEAALEQVGLSQWAKHRPAELSGGQRQRVTIARSLVTSPSLLMLDEPFSGVDPIAVFDVQQIITDLAKSGLAILITDHNVRETLNIVDRAYLIFEGRVESQGNKDFLLNDPISRKLYLGESFTM